MPDVLKERPDFDKPAETIADPAAIQAGIVVLKLREGTRIRVRDQRLVFDPKSLGEQERARLERAGLDAQAVADQLDRLTAILDRDGTEVRAMFGRSQDELDKQRLTGEQLSRRELADLNLYHHLFTNRREPDEIAAFTDELNELDVVEIAYPQPISKPAAVDIAPATPSFTAAQGYLDPAPGGIDARYAWTYPGGRGHGVRCIDVESGWTLDHEDFPPRRALDGAGINAFDRDHGTAVIGVLAAPNNGYGVTGIASDLDIGVCTVWRLAFTPVPTAIDEAAANLRSGDILLVEQHAPGPDPRTPCTTGNCEQWGYVAREYFPADFDVISHATARGIVVVEAAGNGGMNLDDPRYERRFDRTVRDSGAILVGAGDPTNGNVPFGWSNHGSRVDVQGWGDFVMTAGYGSAMDGTDRLRIGGGDWRQWYTDGFDGTSSASAIVAGATACVQGIRRARGLPPLNSVEMRELLRRTGTAQGASPRQIGPLPDLRRAIDSFTAPPPPPPAAWGRRGGVLTSPPAVGRNADGRMEVFGLGMDSCLWHIWQTAPSNGWSNWARRGDRRLTGRPAVILNAHGRLEVFARGDDNAIWHVWQEPNGWSGWASLGGVKTSDPAVALNTDGRLEVFARGTDGTLWRKWQQGGPGGPWYPYAHFWEGTGAPPGGVGSNPAVARNADGRLEVFVRGAADGGVWSRWQTAPGGGWADRFQRIGNGVITGDPTVGTNADGRMELFARGTDGALWHCWQTAPSNGWSDWHPLGGSVREGTRPAVIRNSAGGLEVFAMAADGTVHHRWHIAQPPYWSPWHSLGGPAGADVAAGMNADGRLEVFALAPDRSLIHRWQPW